jgi:hypothetical protein
MPASCLRHRRLGRPELSVVGGLVFLWWDIVEQAAQAPVVEPVDQFHCGVFDLVDGAQPTPASGKATEPWAASSHIRHQHEHNRSPHRPPARSRKTRETEPASLQCAVGDSAASEMLYEARTSKTSRRRSGTEWSSVPGRLPRVRGVYAAWRPGAALANLARATSRPGGDRHICEPVVVGLRQPALQRRERPHKQERRCARAQHAPIPVS